MYIVTITNGNVSKEIHAYSQKLSSGKIVKAINAIDSFTFSILPSNIGFNDLHEYKTLVNVYNTNKQKYVFQGRVLFAPDGMSDNGAIKKEVTCESYLGYLCDSVQEYQEEQEYLVQDFLRLVINNHNKQVEAEKKFTYSCDSTLAAKKITVKIERGNTWETIKKAILDDLKAEISLDASSNKLLFSAKFGEAKTTKIALSKNMKAITREKDPSAIITRLIPLGAKVGEDSEERIDITSVNSGLNYLEDEQAREKYGIHYGYAEFDDAGTPSALKEKGLVWLMDNNKVLVKYSITALDLSLLGLDIDNFELFNTHPIENSLLGIEDEARITKNTIDICEETKSTIELGDNFKTLSELQKEQAGKLNLTINSIATITANYVTNQKLASTVEEERIYTTSLISQTAGDITFSVSVDGGTEAKLSASLSKDSEGKIVSIINQNADEIHLISNKFTIESDNFKLNENGTVNMQNAVVSGHITASSLTIADGATITGLVANEAKELLSTYTVNGQVKTNYFNAGGVSQRQVWSNQKSESLLSESQVIMYYYVDGALSSYAMFDAYGVDTGSDRRIKNSIADMSDKYCAFFDGLRPVTFKYNGKNDSVHAGFIAQEVEESARIAGLDESTLAAIVKTNDIYGLRYNEFIALCVDQIQKLKKRVETLEKS